MGSECTCRWWHDAAVDQREDWDPYPIVLPGRRPPRWIAIGLLLTLTIAVIAATIATRCGECLPWTLSLGFFGLIGVGVMVEDRMRSEARRRLVIDRRGFVADGRRVPWEAVMSMLWAEGPDHTPAHVEVRVRPTQSFEAPSERRVLLFHSEFGIGANALIDLLEAAALPRRVPVLAVEPPGLRRW